MMLGYIVHFTKKSSPVEISALLTRDELIALLKRSVTHTVLSASLVDMEQYRMNHPDEHLERGEQL